MFTVVQVGGCIRALMSARKLAAAITAQKEVILTLPTVAMDRMIMYRKHPRLLLATDVEQVSVYSSKLFAYHNNVDPGNYAAHSAPNATIALPMSEAIILRIAENYYRVLMNKVKSKVAEKNEAEAGYVLEVAGRLALFHGGHFKVRRYGRILGLPVPVPEDIDFVITPATRCEARNDLAVAWTALPRCPGPASVAPRVTPAAPVAVLGGGEGVQAGGGGDVNAGAPPMRHMLYPGPALDHFANVDVIDYCDRGYNFTVSPAHTIKFDAMVEQLDANINSIEFNGGHKFHLFLAVPEWIFKSSYKSRVDNRSSTHWARCFPTPPM